MTKRELDRATKRIEKSLKRIEKFYNRDYMNMEENKESISNFKYYSGYDNKNKRVVRSITLSYKNDDFITEIQKEAKEQGNFISKDIIINIALYYLNEDKQNRLIADFNEWINTYLKY